MMFGVPGLWAVNYDTNGLTYDQEQEIRRVSPQKRGQYISKEDALYEEEDCKKGYIYIYRPGRVIHCYPWEQAEMIRFEMKWEEKEKQEAEKMQQIYAQEFAAQEKEAQASRQRRQEDCNKAMEAIFGSLKQVGGALAGAM